jgi:serine/threonine protein kinase
MEATPSEKPTLHQDGSCVDSRFPRGRIGKYRLLRLLAEGGFASVYLGEHIHLDTLAAIKILRTSLESGDQDEFRKEARIVARLRHPHIIRVHDFDLEANMPFLVMDYAPKGNLRQRHPRGSRLPPSRVFSYLKQIGQALHYAHEQRLIHRDIKPENMLVSEDETLLLSDFGIALILSTQAQTEKEIVGTLAYMAPEQWQGKPVQASDQYALGIVAYEWLAGRCPFQGGPAELAAQHVNLPPPSLPENSQATSELEAVVFRALAKRPEERFPHILDFVQAFERAMQPQVLNLPSWREATVSSRGQEGNYQDTTIEVGQSETISAHAPVESARRSHLSRRSVLAGAAGVLVLASGGGLGWFLAHRPQPKLSGRVSTPTSTPTLSDQPALGTTFHTYRGHHDSVNGVAVSPDGSRIASASSDMTVQVWDTGTGGVNAATYSGHTAAVNAVAWSSDGKFVASGSDDASVRVWQSSDGSNPVSYTQHTGPVKAVAWSPDNQSIASGSVDKTVQVWASADGTAISTYTGHTDEVHAVAWASNGNALRIASGSADATVHIWNANDGSASFIYSGHSGPVNAVAWSPDGTMIASGSSDKTVRVWQAATGTLVYIYGGHTDVVNAVAWSPDGSLIASAGADNTVQIWGTSDGSNPYIYRGHSAAVKALTWLPNPQGELASGSADTTVQIWQAAQ